MAAVPVSFQSDVPITEIQFDVQYNPQHYIISGTASPGPGLQHKVSSSEIAPGTRRVVISAPIPSATLSSGVIANIPFLVYAKAAPGTPGTRPLHIANIVMTNEQEDAIAATVSDGAIIVPPLPEDSDGDGVVDNDDAFPVDPTEWLDSDGDGIGNNRDLDDDGDGLPDSYELANGLDPLNANDAGRYLKYGWTKQVTSLDTSTSGETLIAFVVARDEQGGVYMTGRHSADASTGSILLTKTASAGEFVWSKKFVGGGVGVKAVVVDAAGNIFITGRIGSGTVNFNPEGSAANLSGPSGFITKLSSTGDHQWTLATQQDDYPNGIASDPAGNVYIAGGVNPAASPQGAFVASYTSTGTFRWRRNVSGTSDAWGQDVLVDASTGNTNVYVTGYSSGQIDYDGAGSNPPVYPGDYYAMFVMCLTSDNAFQWTKHVGGAASSVLGLKLARTNDGFLYVAGQFLGTTKFNFDNVNDEIFDDVYKGIWRSFVTKFTSAGDYRWTRATEDVTDTTHDTMLSPSALATDSGGNVYFTGYYTGPTDFDPTSGTDVYSYKNSVLDFQIIGFVSRYNADGSYGWTRAIGGEDSAQITGLAVDSGYQLYVVGDYNTGTIGSTVDIGAAIEPRQEEPRVHDIFSAGLNQPFRFLTKFGPVTFTDRDHDGVLDSEDAFPDDATEWQDTDGDGVGDNREAALGTNPNLADTDGDGLSDAQELQLGTDPKSVDSDSDGMPDGWEVANSLNPLDSSDAALDADNDGLSNVDEYQNGTLPHDADSDHDGMQDGWELRFGLNPNDAADASLDPDGDGLTNLQEFQHVTSPINTDTDGDGMTDSWEVSHGFNPISATDAADDADNDGLTNAQEFRYGTNPAVNDSDGDGLPDGWEVTAGLNPNSNTDASADSDGDGYSNLGEYQLGTSATLLDTDNDGLIDSQDSDPLTPVQCTDSDSDRVCDDVDSDDDNDGMPDTWETAHGLNPLDASDAQQEADGDFVTNYQEYKYGSDPNHNDQGNAISDLTRAWVKTYGSTGNDAGQSVTVDGQGNVYVTGLFAGAVDFDPGTGVDQYTAQGGGDVFITKYTSEGGYAWTKVMSGAGYEQGLAVATDSNGYVYVYGWFNGSVDFDPGPGSYMLAPASGANLFLSKLTADGQHVWTRNLAGTVADAYGSRLAVDGVGNAFVTGVFAGTRNFDLASGADSHTSAGAYDVFITKINANGTYGWTRTIAGTGNDEAYAVALDTAGNVYAAGDVSGYTDFINGVTGDEYDAVDNSHRSAFLMRINSDGTPVWAKAINGITSWSQSEAQIVAIRESDVYVGGYADFGFVLKFDTSGNYLWTRALGNYVYDIVIDNAGSIYVAGDFKNAALFDSVSKTDSYLSADGGDDFFITKFFADGGYVWTEPFNGVGADHVASMAIASGHLYLAGFSAGDMDFDPTAAIDIPASAGGTDVFLLKLATNAPTSTNNPPVAGSDSLSTAEGIAASVTSSVLLTNDTDADGDGLTITAISAASSQGGVVSYSSGTVTYIPPVSFAGVDSFTYSVSDGRGGVATGTVNVNVAAATSLSGIHGYGWTQSFGGTDTEYGRGVATDSAGNVYTAGHYFGTTDFDSSAGTDTRTAAGSGDIYVIRRNADGSYAWTWTAGGTGNDVAYAVAVDAQGAAYVTGTFTGSADFDPSNSATDSLRTAVGGDVFVVKLDAAGHFVWVRTFGSSTSDTAYALGVANGNVYITGVFTGTANFAPWVAGGSSRTSVGNNDIFLSCLGSDGSYRWTRTFGGIYNDSAPALAVESNGNVYVAGGVTPGASGTVNFNPQGTSDVKTIQGTDGFISQWHPDGSYGWTRLISGSGTDVSNAVAVNAWGEVYLTGVYNGAVDFDPSAGVDQRTATSTNGNTFVTQFYNDGSYGWTRSYDWARAYSGPDYGDAGYGMAVDSRGGVYITGSFRGTRDFDPSAGVDQRTSVGNKDIFITHLKRDGSYGWTAAVGGPGDDVGRSIALNGNDNLYVVGDYGYNTTNRTVDFDPRTSVDNKTSAGATDVFLSKYIFSLLAP